MSEDSMKKSEDVFEMRAEYDFSHGVRGRFYQPRKISTSIRLDDDVILFFKKKASESKIGYQTLMNMALREFINRHAT
ncbi:MAG: BrnA antitoxin family protein [Rectinemataceae bacterium]|nr:BrnA antitoxin family protein [Rectinemataceae bacterium]